MDKTEIVERWKRNKAVMDIRDLSEGVYDPCVVKTRRGDKLAAVWYDCPCGPHKAFRSATYPKWTLSDLLTCPVTGKQWILTTDAAAVIADEERRYLDLLARAVKIMPKIVRERGLTPETFRFLHETHGIPEDVARDVLNAAVARCVSSQSPAPTSPNQP